jgi:hypothetical protein
MWKKLKRCEYFRMHCMCFAACGCATRGHASVLQREGPAARRSPRVWRVYLSQSLSPPASHSMVTVRVCGVCVPPCTCVYVPTGCWAYGSLWWLFWNLSSDVFTMPLNRGWQTHTHTHTHTHTKWRVTFPLCCLAFSWTFLPCEDADVWLGLIHTIPPPHTHKQTHTHSQVWLCLIYTKVASQIVPYFLYSKLLLTRSHTVVPYKRE